MRAHARYAFSRILDWVETGTTTPQTTSISTASVASPNTVRTSVTATDSSFTVDIVKDLDIESVETEEADDDTLAPREQTSVHIDEIIAGNRSSEVGDI